MATKKAVFHIKQYGRMIHKRYFIKSSILHETILIGCSELAPMKIDQIFHQENIANIPSDEIRQEKIRHSKGKACEGHVLT